MICPKCKTVLDVDEVLYEESNGSMLEGYCQECKIWVKED